MVFSQALESLQIEIDEFWKSNSMMVSVRVFRKYFTEDLRQFVSSKQIKEVIQAVKKENGVYLENLINKIAFWNNARTSKEKCFVRPSLSIKNRSSR